MNIQHYYIEKGEGQPLILLHGNGESSDYFIHQIDKLSEHFRVIAFDTRGHGRTPRGSKEFTIKQFAEDLYDFMDRLKIKKASLLGFSDGANIALQFTLKYPKRVEKLILNGGNINPSGVKRSVQLPIELGYRVASKFSSKDAIAKQRAEMLGLMVNEPDISPDMLRRIMCPVLVIAGTKDMIKAEHTRLIANSIKDAELAFIEGDHFIANKRYDEFNKTVLEFLQKRG